MKENFKDKCPDIVEVLSQDEMLSIYDIAMRIGMSRVTTERYLQNLAQSGLVVKERQGKKIKYKLANKNCILLGNSIPHNTNGKVVCKKVFISHSSNDKKFVMHLFSLLESIGIPENRIFCSTMTQCGIGNNKNIIDTLRKTIHDETAYLLYVCSPRYYESATSLNEMGAGWILNIPSCCILMRDLDVRNMRGVYNSSRIAVDIKSDDSVKRIEALLKDIFQKLNLQMDNELLWIEPIKTFIKSARRCGPRKKR